LHGSGDLDRKRCGGLKWEIETTNGGW
jgi:hypothetical protein